MRRDLDRLRDFLEEAEKTSNFRGKMYNAGFGNARHPELAMPVYN